MGLQSKLTNLLPLTKCHFMTVVSITAASREKETGLLTVLTFFQWTQSYIFIRQTRPVVNDRAMVTKAAGLGI